MESYQGGTPGLPTYMYRFVHSNTKTWTFCFNNQWNILHFMYNTQQGRTSFSCGHSFKRLASLCVHVGLGHTIAYYYTYHSSSISKIPHFSQVRLCVVERNTGKVVETKYMSADTFFCFHHANTYEDKGK